MYDYPEGDLVWGGIPFSIPTGGNNYWSSRWSCNGPPPEEPCALADNPRSIDVAVHRFGVREVHTIINTAWGRSGTPAYAWLEFFGSGGAYFRKDLVGNDDVRNWDSSSPNEINGITTVNVFAEDPDGKYERLLDKQMIELPNEFHTQTLETIRMTDNGGESLSRAFLYGITVGVTE